MEKDYHKLVNKKLAHWKLRPNCVLEKEKMVSLEKQGKLSYRKIKQLSYIPCDNCEICLGQKVLDDY